MESRARHTPPSLRVALANASGAPAPDNPPEQGGPTPHTHAAAQPDFEMAVDAADGGQ